MTSHDAEEMSTSLAPSTAPRAPLWRRAVRLVVQSARAAAFCAICLAVGLLLASHSVAGQLEEKGLSLGRDLLPLSDLLEGTHKVYFNGETIYLASTVTTQDKGAVLDRFEATCREHSGGLIEEFDRLPAAKKKQYSEKAPLMWSLRFGMVRRENKDEGLVMCFAQKDGGGLRAVVQRLGEVAKTGELGALGNLRYAYVKRTEKGGSHVLTTFTEGKFNLFRALGRGAEAPGQDPPGVPRPPGSRRMLSVSADGAPYGVQSYQTDQKAADVVAFYRNTLAQAGWQRAVADDDVFNTAIYQRGGVMLTVSAIELIAGQKTTVTMTEGTSTNPRPDFVAETH
jgi:hypothetical protein